MALKDFLFGKQKEEKSASSRQGGGNTLNKDSFRDGFAGQTLRPPMNDYAPAAFARYPRYRVLEEAMTGMTEYGYFCDGRQLGAAMVMITPRFPVRLQCEGLNLGSEFDKTIFPGVTREILDENTGDVYAVVTGYSEGTHTLQTPEGTFVVRTGQGIWDFFHEGVLIASLNRSEQLGERLNMIVTQSVPDSLALLMLAFPLLQIWR